MRFIAPPPPLSKIRIVLDTSQGPAEMLLPYNTDLVSASGWGHIYIPLSDFHGLHPNTDTQLIGMRFFTDNDDKFDIGQIQAVVDQQQVQVALRESAPNVVVNLPVAFTATAVVGPSVPTMEINFGDGKTEKGGQLLSSKEAVLQVNHVYTQTGVYTVTVTATDKSGIKKPGTAEIKVGVDRQ